MAFTEEEFLERLEKDRKFRMAVAGLLGYREIMEKLESHDRKFNEILEELREHRRVLEEHDHKLNEMLKDIQRRISALGARWGLMSEEAFRNGLRSLLEREFGLKVERWKARDDEGLVYGYPCEVEIDLAIRDGKVILIEVSSHVRSADVSAFKRKAEFYERSTGRKPDKLLMITPFADRRALWLAERVGVEIYTRV